MHSDILNPSQGPRISQTPKRQARDRTVLRLDISQWYRSSPPPGTAILSVRAAQARADGGGAYASNEANGRGREGKERTAKGGKERCEVVASRATGAGFRTSSHSTQQAELHKTSAATYGSSPAYRPHQSASRIDPSDGGTTVAGRVCDLGALALTPPLTFLGSRLLFDNAEFARHRPSCVTRLVMCSSPPYRVAQPWRDLTSNRWQSSSFVVSQSTISA